MTEWAETFVALKFLNLQEKNAHKLYIGWPEWQTAIVFNIVENSLFSSFDIFIGLSILSTLAVNVYITDLTKSVNSN